MEAWGRDKPTWVGKDFYTKLGINNTYSVVGLWYVVVSNDDLDLMMASGDIKGCKTMKRAWWKLASEDKQWWRLGIISCQVLLVSSDESVLGRLQRPRFGSGTMMAPWILWQRQRYYKGLSGVNGDCFCLDFLFESVFSFLFWVCLFFKLSCKIKRRNGKIRWWDRGFWRR